MEYQPSRARNGHRGQGAGRPDDGNVCPSGSTDPVQRVEHDRRCEPEDGAQAASTQRSRSVHDRTLHHHRRKIRLDQPIRETGTYMVDVEVPGGDHASVKTIVAEQK